MRVENPNPLTGRGLQRNVIAQVENGVVYLILCIPVNSIEGILQGISIFIDKDGISLLDTQVDSCFFLTGDPLVDAIEEGKPGIISHASRGDFVFAGQYLGFLYPELFQQSHDKISYLLCGYGLVKKQPALIVLSFYLGALPLDL